MQLGLVCAFSMYIECAEGGLDPEWAIHPDKRMTFWAFRDKHATAALLYDPTELKYPGDSFVRAVTVKTKRKRKVPTSLVAVTQEDLETKPHLIAHMSKLVDHL